MPKYRIASKKAVDINGTHTLYRIEVQRSILGYKVWCPRNDEEYKDLQQVRSYLRLRLNSDKHAKSTWTPI